MGFLYLDTWTRRFGLDLRRFCLILSEMHPPAKFDWMLALSSSLRTVPKGSKVVPFWAVYCNPQEEKRSYPQKHTVEPLGMTLERIYGPCRLSGSKSCMVSGSQFDGAFGPRGCPCPSLHGFDSVRLVFIWRSSVLTHAEDASFNQGRSCILLRYPDQRQP